MCTCAQLRTREASDHHSWLRPKYISRPQRMVAILEPDVDVDTIGFVTIPGTAEELTPDWLSEVLDTTVSAVEVLDAHSGTTGRARIGVKSDGDVPDTLFVKLQPFTEERREFLRTVGLGVSEAQFYAAIGNELPVRAPRVWHSSFDDAD